MPREATPARCDQEWAHFYLDGSECSGFNQKNIPCSDWEVWYFAPGTDDDGDGYQAVGSCGSSPRAIDCDDNDPFVNTGTSCFGDGDGESDNDQCYEISNNIEMGSSSNLLSGNLFHSQQVLSMNGSGLTANITISYNSLDTTLGQLGKGWTHNYNINIITSLNNLILVEEDGRRINFNNNDDSTYSPDPSSGSHATITKNADYTYTLTKKSGMQYDFDFYGVLTSITDRNGNTLTLTYTGDNLTSIMDSYSRVTTLAYDANNKIESITDPAGRVTTFTYDTDFLSTVTDPSGGTWTYTYDANGRMETKTDPLGYTTTYTYDANGRIDSSQDPEGNTKSIIYDPAILTATVTEKNGSQWTYVYDNILNVPVEITDPDNNETIYVYDLATRDLLSKTGPGSCGSCGGSEADYTYDADGNMLTKTEVPGTGEERTTTYTYNSYGQVLTITDDDGNITEYRYDTSGNLIEEEDAQDKITYHTYNAIGERESTTDPNTNATNYTYDPYGNLASMTNVSLSQTTSYAYDIMGNLLSMSDANSNTTTYTYDSSDRLITETRPDGGIITYEYDLAGNRTAVTDANGNRTTFTYDGLNRLLTTTDLQGNTTNYTYDPEGNIASMTIKDSLGTVMTSTTYTYDIYNRQTRTTHADTTYTEQTYDAYGNVLTERDENGNITNFAYDALNRVVSVTDPLTGITSYTYDSRDNLRTVEDGNTNTTTYTYNSLNRLTSTASSDTGTTAYTYDPNGNLISKTDANSVITTYVYDVLNRQTAVQFPDTTQNITYTYDEAQYQNSTGRLTTMTDPSGTTNYTYDKMGRMTRETRQINNLFYRTDYAYDLNGNVTAVTYPGTRTVAYAYDQLNRVASVTETLYGVTRTLADNITYQPFGGMTSMTQGNGIVTTKTYNNRYQLTGLITGALKDLIYSRDNVGNITAITDNIDPLKTNTYIYDNLYRLTDATGQWGTLSYDYDSVGNRTNEITDTGSTTYTYTASTNKLASTTGEKAFNFSYDNDGNTTVENTRQYIYDQNQRLIEVQDNSTPASQYVYNGNGQRVRKWLQAGNQCALYHYDKNGLLIAESTSAGTVTAEYVYLNGSPLAKIEGNSVYYYHNDHLGTPITMTDESGSTVWEGEYLPFGEEYSITGTIINNLRFPGQYYDSETGLHYNYFRDYNPVIGRYIEADPIGIERGNNHLFVYVGNSPVNFTDPWGLFAPAIPAAIAACAATPACARAVLAGSAATVLAVSKLIETIEVPSKPFTKTCPTGDPGDFIKLCIGGCRSVYSDSFFRRQLCIVGCIISAF